MARRPPPEAGSIFAGASLDDSLMEGDPLLRPLLAGPGDDRHSGGSRDAFYPDEGGAVMADVLYLGMTLGFFWLSWLLVRLCERL